MLCKLCEQPMDVFYSYKGGEYYICRDCSSVLYVAPRFKLFIKPWEALEVLPSVVFEEYSKISKTNSYRDLIHNCLQCNATIVSLGPWYKCIYCGCEWGLFS